MICLKANHLKAIKPNVYNAEYCLHIIEIPIALPAGIILYIFLFLLAMKIIDTNAKNTWKGFNTKEYPDNLKSAKI